MFYDAKQNPFDKAIAIIGAMVPIGIAIGNMGFETIVSLTGLIWIIRLIKYKDLNIKKLIKHPVILPSIALYICILISLFVNNTDMNGYMHDIVTIRHLLFVVAMVDTSYRFPVRKYLFYGLIAGFIYSVVNILSVYITGYDFIGRSLARYTSKLKEGNRYPVLLTYYATFFLAWGLLDRNNLMKRVYILAAGTTGLLFLSFFNIRTLLISFVAGMFFTMCYAIYKKKSFRLGLFSILIIITSTVIFFKTTDMLEFASLYERYFIWKVTFKIWLNNPLFGVGIFSYQDSFYKLVKSENIKPFLAPDGVFYYLDAVCHAHNSFLQILSCNGLAGLISALWLAFNVIKLTFKHAYDFGLGFIPWLAVYLIISLIGMSVYDSWYSALSVFIIVSISCIDPSEREGLKESI